MLKPPAFAELVALIRAPLRRGRTYQALELKLADFEIDLVTRDVQRGGQAIHLTSRFNTFVFFVAFCSFQLQRGANDAAFAKAVFAAERGHHAAETAEAVPGKRGGDVALRLGSEH